MDCAIARFAVKPKQLRTSAREKDLLATPSFAASVADRIDELSDPASPPRARALVVLGNEHVRAIEREEPAHLSEALRVFLFAVDALYAPVDERLRVLEDGIAKAFGGRVNAKNKFALGTSITHIWFVAVTTPPRLTIALRLASFCRSRGVSRPPPVRRRFARARARSATSFSTSACARGNSSWAGIPNTTPHASAVARFGFRASRSNRDTFVPVWHPRRKATSS